MISIGMPPVKKGAANGFTMTGYWFASSAKLELWCITG